MADVLVPPAHLWIPDRASSAGEDACDLAESAGLVLDPEQRLVLDAVLSEDAHGRWAALEAAVVVGRQNGKTVALQAICLADVFLFGADLVVWTAHLFRTAVEAFRDLKSLVEGSPHLRRKVRKIIETYGSESIELMSGARINFMARSGSAGRGLSGDRVILDEAFALSERQVGALIPTLSARPNPQILYASSAGHATSDILRSVRERGRRGDDPSLVWVEWCAPDPDCEADPCDHEPGTRGCSADDRTRWQAANPAMGRRIRESYIAAERRSLPGSEFVRERLGWWDDPLDQRAPIEVDAWDDLADDRSQIVGAKVWALDVSPTGKRAAIGVAGLRADGKPHVELVESRAGTGWVVPRLQQLVSAHRTVKIRAGNSRRSGVLVDPTGPAGELIPRLRSARIDPYLVTATDMGQACGGLRASVRDHNLVHIGQRQVRDALAGAARRPIGDGAWAFARKASDVDITSIVVVALALHGLRISDRPGGAPAIAAV